ncbi:TPA: hypothetical protein N0F65_009065 [Lagenidium giganteum]|uniref:DUF4485 domain-containing protein n=1 Tax=Lagenidium giganteum TaxID=4803 RepID=A0AAV2YRA6_9STRA|nr:TPA: hypothetical protein N0F65_009065 [Lagenidium giganteum]
MPHVTCIFDDFDVHNLSRSLEICNVGPSEELMNLEQQQTHVRTLLAQAHELNQRVQQSKHQQIRVARWIQALQHQPIANATWMKNVLEYVTLLIQMLIEGRVEDPFTHMPPQGTLPVLPRHKVSALVARFAKKVPARRKPSDSRSKAANECAQSIVHEPPQRITRHQQCQTTEQDDQWEWQRVWKGAFERLRREQSALQAQNDALRVEVKELRAVIVGHEKVAEKTQEEREHVNQQNRAEVETLKAIHALEIEELRKKHRQEVSWMIQALVRENDEAFQRRHRTNEVDELLLTLSTTNKTTSNRKTNSVTVQSKHDQEHMNDAFLRYVDQFYEDTRAYTRHRP